jgi:hypothetical protein
LCGVQTTGLCAIQEVLDALAIAMGYISRSVIYAICFLPLALVCYLLIVVLLKIDLAVFALSTGLRRFEIARALRKSARKCFWWYANQIAFYNQLLH